MEVFFSSNFEFVFELGLMAENKMFKDIQASILIKILVFIKILVALGTYACVEGKHLATLVIWLC